MTWLGPLASFGGSLIIAIITALLTVRLALKRFYAEKWWERQGAAYESIFEALHHVRNYADTNLSFSLRGRELPEEGERELTEKLQGAMAELRKQVDIGSFVLSESAIRVMVKFMSDLDGSTKTTCWQEHLELKLASVDSCLSSMRLIARQDLRLK
ncbi:hypothetical protein [Burkholderia sp. USMB20]|uniref:hypothetical protein n=1 Tax=Burkholderia sp. USMB20 TaxID=1571773 RepID=UPI0005CE5860|nr:hypothetical protein [Burkholderia sp. USMB20]TGN93126.1 hypothetical protein PL79_031460 [Burkholderia sp. USMB20]